MDTSTEKSNVKKIGEKIVSAINFLKNNKGKITIIIALIGAIGTWMANDCSMEYFNQVIELFKQLISSSETQVGVILF